jgi:hypothetical protein
MNSFNPGMSGLDLMAPIPAEMEPRKKMYVGKNGETLSNQKKTRIIQKAHRALIDDMQERGDTPKDKSKNIGLYIFGIVFVILLGIIIIL